MKPFPWQARFRRGIARPALARWYGSRSAVLSQARRRLLAAV